MGPRRTASGFWTRRSPTPPRGLWISTARRRSRSGGESLEMPPSVPQIFHETAGCYTSHTATDSYCRSLTNQNTTPIFMKNIGFGPPYNILFIFWGDLSFISNNFIMKVIHRKPENQLALLHFLFMFQDQRVEKLQTSPL